MLLNTNIIETNHDLDALIRIAHVHPSERLRDKLIDCEIDDHGNFVGFALSNKIWHDVIPDAA